MGWKSPASVVHGAVGTVSLFLSGNLPFIFLFALVAIILGVIGSRETLDPVDRPLGLTGIGLGGVLLVLVILSMAEVLPT